MRTKTYRRVFLYPLLGTALLVLASSCAVVEEGHPRAQRSDLCSLLSVAEVHATYRAPAPEFAATKHLDDSSFYKAGMASCHFGPKDDLGGVSLRVPIGGPVLDVAELIGGSYARDGKDIVIGSDKAFILRSGREAAIAVAHGATQFVLRWTPLMNAVTDEVPEQQLIALAKSVIGKISGNLNLPAQDIALQCGRARDAEAVVGATIVMARGSANHETLNCDYLGPAGIVRGRAVREADGFIDHRIAALEKNPRDVIDPPVAQDAALTQIDLHHFNVEGYLRRCCTLKFDYRTVNETTDHSGGFDAGQRQFVTSFIEAARSWSVQP